MKTHEKDNPNDLFIFLTLLGCILSCGALIFLLKPEDINIVNSVTIIGTILTIGGIVFSIREQYKIKRTSEAIKKIRKPLEIL